MRPLSRPARLAAATAVLLAAGAAALPLLTPAAAAPDQARIKRGEYLANIMDCGGCHTTGVFLGRPEPARYLAGSEVGFHLPGLGIFYPPNLTPDRETGLGTWSEAEIVAAVRKGVRPDGRQLAPAMPYGHYSHLTDEDAFALAAYLKSLPPVKHAVPAITGDGEKPQAAYLTVKMPE